MSKGSEGSEATTEDFGYTRPMKLSANLANIVGMEEAGRYECIKRLRAYLKANNLRDPKNKQFFTPDKKLAKIFGTDRIDSLDMWNYLDNHLTEIDSKIGGLKPGAPKTGKDSVQVCEICDGYIKDLDHLRNHMQFIHKVKIHPKMIQKRPPLNCQKCQYRFFTDQGLERHLLGSHGLVTANMQDLANKGQDSGRCPQCGKMFHWKLLNHVAKDHSKTLKPAHLSYKCTVCCATFGVYKLFEDHVYSAHSKKPSTSSVKGSGSRPSKPKDKVAVKAVKKEAKEEPEDGLEQTNIVKVKASNLSRIVEAKQPKKEDSMEFKQEVKEDPEDGLEQTNIVKVKASNMSRIVETKQPQKEDSTEFFIPSTVLAGPRRKKSKKN